VPNYILSMAIVIPAGGVTMSKIISVTNHKGG